MYECPICKIMPSSHSLKVEEKNGILYYYTCPSKAIFYDDVKGIVNHYHGMLSEIQDKPWVWVFDGVEFGFMHAIQTTVAIEVAKIITKFSKNLKKIIIINPTMYITTTHKIVMPFLSTKVKNIIEINYKATCTEDLFV